jgi:predicted transposase YdaD
VCVLTNKVKENRSFGAIKTELWCLKCNRKKLESDDNFEEQRMIDTRMAIVFYEMSNLIEEFGSALFNKSN